MDWVASRRRRWPNSYGPRMQGARPHERRDSQRADQSLPGAAALQGGRGPPVLRPGEPSRCHGQQIGRDAFPGRRRDLGQRQILPRQLRAAAGAAPRPDGPGRHRVAHGAVSSGQRSDRGDGSRPGRGRRAVSRACGGRPDIGRDRRNHLAHEQAGTDRHLGAGGLGRGRQPAGRGRSIRRAVSLSAVGDRRARRRCRRFREPAPGSQGAGELPDLCRPDDAPPSFQVWPRPSTQASTWCRG
jgi:hypothetical protein